MFRKKSHFLLTREKSHILVYIFFRDLGIWNSSWWYWFFVQGLKWPFSTFTLVPVTHLTELFNARDWSDNGSAESETSLYLILSQGPMWQRGTESWIKVTICSFFLLPTKHKNTFFQSYILRNTSFISEKNTPLATIL